MKAILILIFIFFSHLGYSQKTTAINIVLENTKDIKIERRSSIFNRKINYDLKKINDNQYILDYFGENPDIIMLNYRPLFITPGDSIQLKYKLISRTYDSKHDTIIVSGHNSSNYQYSNIRNIRQVNNEFPELSNLKYRSNIPKFYTDVVKFHASFDKFYSSLLEKTNCDKDLQDFFKRESNFQFLFNLMYFESVLVKEKNQQLLFFSNKLDSAFKNTLFLPTDTVYSCKMEETFKAYLYHLVHVTFNNAYSNNEFDTLYKYVKEYENPFIREYFIFFLIVDNKDLIEKFKPKDIQVLIKGIKNPSIINALKGKYD